jgi:hypothetical protein
MSATSLTWRKTKFHPRTLALNVVIKIARLCESPDSGSGPSQTRRYSGGMLRNKTVGGIFHFLKLIDMQSYNHD